MIILGIETSCDETSVALVENGKTVLSESTYSQIKEHGKFFGVVPEIASRLHVETLFTLLKDCVSKANLTLQDVNAIAVTREPGLVGSLLIGLTVAKTLAFTLNVPLIPVNHLWAHLYAPFLEQEQVSFPYAGLLVSGGHTLLCVVKGFNDVQIMGSTIDDAVGECYDKVAKMLGLSYPGGPIIDTMAKQGKDNAYNLPLVNLNNEEDRYNFSYSGLKTAVRRIIEKEDENLNKNDLAACFQKRAVDVLVKKAQMLCDDKTLKHLVVAGGVACNSYLREKLKVMQNVTAIVPSLYLCTDNASMVAGFAYHLPKLERKELIELDVKDKVIRFRDKKALRFTTEGENCPL